jgi:hypothetical protein
MVDSPAHPSFEREEIPLKKSTQKKIASPQLLPPIPDPSTTRVQHEALIKGFTAVTVAVSFAGIDLIT